MKKNDIIKLLIGVLLIVLIGFYLYRKGYFEVVEKVALCDFLILIFLTLLSYFVSGFQIFYLVIRQNKVRISFTDTLLLPISMSLFSYIIPTNGGLLYSVLFLKKKYNIDSSKGFSIGVFSIYISFIVTGIFGIVACVYTGNYNFWLIAISLIMIFFSFIIAIINKFFQKINTKKTPFIAKIQNYINNIVLRSNMLITDRNAIFVNILINIVYIILALISYQWINIILETKLPLTSVFVIILITRISSLIRLLPGNLGLEELYTAGIFKLIGKDPSVGMVFSIFLRLSTFVVFIPLGILHTVLNLKSIKIYELKNIFKKEQKK